MPKKKTDAAVAAPPDESPTTGPQTLPETSLANTTQTISRSDLLTINDQERGITPEDSDDAKWNYLAGAAKRRSVLTGVVAGLEGMNTDSPICVVDYEGIRVVIPASEMFLSVSTDNGGLSHDQRILLGRMLGAKVDFILAGVSLKGRAAVASRKAALLQHQAKYFKSGRVKPGIRVSCRVIAVGNNRITVEACGVDSTISANALSWEWFPDVADIYSAGDLVVARVISVTEDTSTGQFECQLSVKAATSNPDLPTLRSLNPKSVYFGTVTGVHDQLIFVRLQVGANAKTKLFHSKEMPSKFDTVSFQVRSVDEETGVAYGLITRIIRRHSKLH